MKVNLPVEFNREKYNLKYKSHICKIKTDTNFCKYPFKSTHKILNYKTVYAFPDQCKKEKVTICDY